MSLLLVLHKRYIALYVRKMLRLQQLLYKNMVAAKADWLYELEAWNDIFDEEKRKELYKTASLRNG